jgi:large subunit ribosomal protein L15
MNILSSLTPIVAKSAKRRGRGIGSGKGGHTTGRGAKGDKVRGKPKITFDGSKIKKGWIKRLPFLRGKHRLLAFPKAEVVNLALVDSLFPKEHSVVSPKSLGRKSVKILGTGNLTKALIFKDVTISISAKAKILALGGKID